MNGQGLPCLVQYNQCSFPFKWAARLDSSPVFQRVISGVFDNSAHHWFYCTNQTNMIGGCVLLSIYTLYSLDTEYNTNQYRWMPVNGTSTMINQHIATNVTFDLCFTQITVRYVESPMFKGHCKRQRYYI